MKVLLIIVCLSFLSGPLCAQDSTRLKRIEYVTGASAAFALIDYLGWNLLINTRPGNEIVSTSVYRDLQALTQVAISYFLYKTCGLTSTIAFNLMWWTWADDLGFYGYQFLFNEPYPWPNRTYRNDLRDNHITWASWTPIGLMRPFRAPIARDALYAQALAGIGLSIAILW